MYANFIFFLTHSMISFQRHPFNSASFPKLYKICKGFFSATCLLGCYYQIVSTWQRWGSQFNNIIKGLTLCNQYVQVHNWWLWFFSLLPYSPYCGTGAKARISTHTHTQKKHLTLPSLQGYVNVIKSNRVTCPIKAYRLIIQQPSSHYSGGQSR